MASLTGNSVASTYQSLIKVSDNSTVGSTLENLTDGVGNPTSVWVSNDAAAISGSFAVSGSTTLLDSVSVEGDITATGTITGTLEGTAATASYVETAQTASYVANAVSASYSATANSATSAVSSSYALTASYALNGGGGGSINTSSFATTGSNTFVGEQTISGSIQISGSIIPATDGVSTTSSFDLGSATNAWKDIWVSNGTINFVDGTGNVQAALSSTDQGLQIQNYPADTGSIPVFNVSGSGTFTDGLTVVTGSVNIGSSSIQSVSASAGDGSGLSTLELKPDTSTGDNRYVVLDPTGPNHIHVRAGGTIDQSTADLYIGGEKHYVRVSDSSPGVYINSERIITTNSYSFISGSGFSAAEWTSDGSGSYFITINDPTQQVYDATWAFGGPSIFAVVHNGNYVELTVIGTSTPGMPQPVTITVAEAPPDVPTVLEQVNYEIRVYRNSEIEVDSDVNIRASDDLRLYSHDRFRLLNYAVDEAIEITTNYDNNDKTWYFNPDGTLQFPDGTFQATAFTTGSLTISGSISFVDNSLIQAIPNSSGDGSGLSTLQLKPDENTGDNRYVVLDPTGPNHIHIRPGGIIDQSSADLIIGGENTNVIVSDALQNVQIKTTDAEVEFIGYIDNGFGDGSGATLHVTDMVNGTITDGMTVYGPGIPGGYTLQFGTVVAPQGDGGVGNYYLPGGDFLTTPSTYVGGAITASNWTFGADGIIKLNNGIGEIYASPDNGLVRIGTAAENVAPNAQIILGGPDQILKIVSGPPLRQWVFDASGSFNLTGSINGAANLATTGSNNFNGNQVITGSLAQGNNAQAIGDFSHAEGDVTTAVGDYSHAEGLETIASGSYSHAEGWLTIASGSWSHAEGRSTQAIGMTSHAEGDVTTAVGDYSHAEGQLTIALGDGTHTEGQSTQAIGNWSHAEGQSTQAIGNHSHAEGNSTKTGTQNAYYAQSVVNGVVTLSGSYGDVASSFVADNRLYLYDNPFDNFYNRRVFLISQSYFDSTNTIVELYDTSVNTTTAYVGDVDYLVNNAWNGDQTIPGTYSHAEGEETQAIGYGTHAEGTVSIATGFGSHAEGSYTLAVGITSHAEGNNTKAIGDDSHTEGYQTIALGQSSHAEGYVTIASGSYSHAEGYLTIASGSGQHVSGKYNQHNNDTSYFVVGIGLSEETRKDGFTVDVDANGSGSVMIPNNTNAPSVAKTGSMYVDPANNKLWIYTGNGGVGGWVTSSLG